MYLSRIPNIIKRSYPSCVWNYARSSNKIYITFDDGPHPDTTPEVLRLLKTEGVKATFFCVGENVARYPDLFYQIIEEGHLVGNHTHRHLNGFKTSASEYWSDIHEANQLIQSDLFRPPYGRITPRQLSKVKKDYKVIMWSLIVGDWDTSKSKEACFKEVENNLKSGDILVLHDSVKAFDRMIYTLQETIKLAKSKGLQFGTIRG